MRRRWRGLPIRVRAAATALGFLLALFALWGAVDWALPSTLLTARLLEREHLFGPGEVAASGEIVLGGEATKDRYVILRSGDKFASVALERIYSVLWEANVYGGFFIMAPSEERPLAYSFLDRATRTSVSAGRSQITGSHYQLAVSTHDPAVERVEATMALVPPLEPEEEADWLDEHGVTEACVPAGDQVWTVSLTLPQSGGRTAVRLRGYGADGALIYDVS